MNKKNLSGDIKKKSTGRENKITRKLIKDILPDAVKKANEMQSDMVKNEQLNWRKEIEEILLEPLNNLRDFKNKSEKLSALFSQLLIQKLSEKGLEDFGILTEELEKQKEKIRKEIKLMKLEPEPMAEGSDVDGIQDYNRAIDDILELD